MRPWKHFGARLSERLWPTAPTGRRSASAGNSLSISKPITTGAGSTALWGTNHLWNSKQQTTKIERTDSTKCVHKKGGRELRCFPGESRPENWMTIPKFAAARGRQLLSTKKAPASADEWLSE